MKKIHFIGIGGIGVSALAKYYFKKGRKVSGSDLVASEITEGLKKSGVKVFLGKHKEKNLPKNTDLVVYSPAVKKDNPELKKAKKLGIKCQSYPEALGELTKQYFTIAVSGTHGKTTVTTMIGLLLEKAGFDPTVIVGTKVKEFKNSNCRVGKSQYLVIEADEWQASFLNYWPKIIVLTNIETEHLDYFKNLNHILRTYQKYISHLSKDGILAANRDDKNILKILKRKNAIFPTIVENLVYYSLRQKEARQLKKILKIPGKHNISNALAALTIARTLKIPDKISFDSLSKYRGSWRRFELTKLKINGKKITVISDFAHHPTEIKSTLKAIREKFIKRKIWCVYQPHQYQRTFYLFNDFVEVFKKALQQPKPLIDNLIIADIYDVVGREKNKIKKGVSSEKLIKKINNLQANYLQKEKIVNYLRKNLRGGEVVVIMGAGDIYKLCEQLGS